MNDHVAKIGVIFGAIMVFAAIGDLISHNTGVIPGSIIGLLFGIFLEYWWKKG